MKKMFKILYIDSEVNPRATVQILEQILYSQNIIASVTVSNEVIKAISVLEDSSYNLVFLAVTDNRTSSFQPLFSRFRSYSSDIPIILIGTIDIFISPESLSEFSILGILRKPYNERSIIDIVSQFYSKKLHY